MEMKKYLFLLLCCMTTAVMAESKLDYLSRPNELRIGWGDQLFETLMWHNTTATATTMPEDFRLTYRENHVYSQHIWVEYQRRVNHWFSYGGMVDGSGVRWDDVTRNGKGTELSRVPNRYFYNLVIMPTIRFTYFFHPNVNIYSGLGFGMDINGGTETNVRGQHTEVGAAVNLTVLGVSANYQRWFMAVDLGGLTALQNKDAIYMALSRMINVSIGARF